VKPIEPAQFPWKDFRRYTYPLGLDLGDCAFLSGMTASTYDAALDKVVAKGTLREQTSTVIEKIRAVLQAAGYGAGDVVSIVQYVPAAALGSLAEFDELLRAGGLGGAARHVVPVARLLRRDALLEIEAIAARRSGRTGEAVRIASSGGNALAFGGHAGGTIEAQIERLSGLLAASGSGWSQVARLRVFVASDAAAALDEAVDAIRSRVPVLPAVPAVGVPALPPGYDGAQLAIEWLTPPRPGSRPQADPSESLQAVASGLVRRAGPFLVATGLQADAGAGGLREQARYLYGEAVPALLARHGAGMEHLVQTVEWLPLDALPEYRPTAEIRRSLLSEPFPVASGLVCSALPAGAKLAVDFVARVPSDAGAARESAS